MPVKIASLSDLTALPFEDIIDVRSPAEFAEDHVPGAISLPVLSNEERAKVGTIYVQEDRFLARKIGAALVARNAAAHLQGPLADRSGGWRPLVYCWRGGQRSGSFTSILQQVGWRADVLEGGYKSYRRLVVRALYDDPLPHEVILIDGGTGTAKTRLLGHIAEQGGQVLDLEAMAEHRGSLFGPMGKTQPSQKSFESHLAMTLAGLDPSKPVYVEAESSKIGRLILPPSLWKPMTEARSIALAAPVSARAAHLLNAYPDMIEDHEKLDSVLGMLVRYHGHEQVDAWRALAKAGAFASLAQQLIEAHYDPRYARISRQEPSETIALESLSEAELTKTAARIIASHGK